MAKKKPVEPSIKRTISTSLLGTAKYGEFSDSAFFHTAAPPHLKKEWFIDAKDDDDKRVRIPLPHELPEADGKISTYWEISINGKRRKYPLKSDSVLTMRVNGKEVKFYLNESGLSNLRKRLENEHVKRLNGAQRALDRFREKNTQAHLFWLAERIGHTLMDYHGLDTRHIGAEVSARIPVEKKGKLVEGTEVGSRDMVVYGKDANKNRIAFTFEIQPVVETRNLNKVWYAFSNDVRLDKKKTEIKHSIILTTRITDTAASYLGLQRDRSGTYTATGEGIDVKRLESMSEVIRSEEADRLYRILAMMPQHKEHLEEAKKNPVGVRVSDFLKSLTRTVLAVSDRQGTKINQFILFRPDKHGRLAPVIIDKARAGEMFYEALQEKKKRELETYEKGFLGNPDGSNEEFRRLKARLEKEAER